MKALTIDIETTGLDYNKDSIVSIVYQIEGQASPTVVYPSDYIIEPILSSLLSDPTVICRGHNVKFDLRFLANAGYEIKCIPECTKVMAYVRYPTEENGLKYLAKNKLGRTVVELDDIKITPKKKELPKYLNNTAYIQVGKSFYSKEEFLAYNIADVRNCRDLDNILPKVGWYEDVERPLLKLLLDTELRGAQINRPYLEDLDKVFCEKESVLNAYLQKELQVDNPNSPVQLADGLKRCGIDLDSYCSRTPTGRYKMDKLFLKRQAWKGQEICKQVLEYKKFNKLRSTYTSAILSVLDKGDKLHGSFNQAGSEDDGSGDPSAGTKTGRLTSSDPNLQNIPFRTEEGKKIRKSFVASPGHILFDFDLSQIEPRVLAHWSQAPKLIEIFSNKQDIHSIFGSDMFGRKITKDTPAERFIGKTGGLATIYGCWYKKLLAIHDNLSESPLDKKLYEPFIPSLDSAHPEYVKKLIQQFKTEEDAREEYAKWMFFDSVQRGFHANNREIFNWREAHIKRTKALGYVTTIGGRRIPVSGLSSSNKWEVLGAERLAVNYLIQGSAADIMKKILVNFKEEIVDRGLGYLIATVHDEVLGELVDQGEKKNRENLELVRTIFCESVHLNNVDIACDGGFIQSWGDKK